MSTCTCWQSRLHELWAITDLFSAVYQIGHLLEAVWELFAAGWFGFGLELLKGNNPVCSVCSCRSLHLCV